MPWRVVYGETRPAWEKVFSTRRLARNFAREQKRLGDKVFSIAKTIDGEPPRSIMAALEAQDRVKATSPLLGKRHD